MGGKGTWLVAEAAPDRFAAIAPISAVAVRPDKAGDLLRYTPTWIICGSDDGGFTDGSKQMAEVIKAAGGNIQLTVYPTRATVCGGGITPSPSFTTGFLNISETAPPPLAPPRRHSRHGDQTRLNHRDTETQSRNEKDFKFSSPCLRVSVVKWAPTLTEAS